MKPLNHHILVELDPKEDKTKNGIYLPGRQKVLTGTVLMVGQSVKYVKEGDHVRFHNNCGHLHNYQGKDCIFLSEEKQEIIAIL